MSKMIDFKIPKWLDRPHVPNETAQQRLASITLHRIALFILVANLLAAIFIPSDGSDFGVRIIGLTIPLIMLLLQRFWSTKAGFVFWYAVTFALACIEILARGGILSSGFLIIARLILGSSIAFSQGFTVVMGVVWLVGSFGAALAQQFGLWVPQAAYTLTPFGAWWAVAGSTLNFGMRVVVVIDEFRRGQLELRERIAKLARARAEEESLIAKRDRLFWYLSHELRSPLTRLKLQIRAAQRTADNALADKIGGCGMRVGELSRLTEQSLLLAQLRGRLSFPLDDDVELMVCLGAIRKRIEQGNSKSSPDGAPSFEIQSDGDLHIRSSADLLEKGISPLLSALARNGKVRIVGRDLGDSVELQIAGADNGSGNRTLPESVIRELAHRHDGEMCLEQVAAGQITYRVTLAKNAESVADRPALAEDGSGSGELEEPLGFLETLFRYFVMFAAAWGAVWTLFHGVLIDRGSWRSVSAGLVVTTCSLIALWVYRRQGIKPAFLTLYLGTVAVALPAMIYSGGVLNPVVFVLVSVLLTSVLIYSTRIVFMVISVTLVALGAVTLLQVRGLWPSSYEPIDPFGHWMILIVSGATFGLVLIPAIIKQRSVQTSLELQSRELEEAHARNESIQERQLAVFGNIMSALSLPLRELHDSLYALPDSFAEMREECVLLENRLRQMRVISEAGRITADSPRQIELNDVLKQVCRDANVEFAQTMREVVFRTGEEKYRIEGDAELLMSAFYNVIHNALRFTKAGTAVAVTLRSAAPNSVEVLVSDHGPGVADDFLDAIFEPFVQAGNGSSGTGLGLAIAREVISSHGGEIKARNKTEGGLEVSITLPLSTLLGALGHSADRK